MRKVKTTATVLTTFLAATVLGFSSVPHAADPSSPAQCAEQVVATVDACTTLQPPPAGHYACSSDCSLDVQYDGVAIGCGGVLSLDQAATAPRITYPQAESGKLYALMVLNTDDSIPIAPILHYFQANVPGEELQDGVDAILEGTGSALKGYHGPNPCWATPCAAAYSTFTYVWLLLSQTGSVSAASVESTMSFDLDAAMATHGLGPAPLASSYFLSGACACPLGDAACLDALPPAPEEPEDEGATDSCAPDDYACLYAR